MNISATTFMLARYIPILPEIIRIITDRLVQITADECHCTGIRMASINVDENGEQIFAELNARFTCKPCRQPMYIPSNMQYYARIFVFDGSWRQISYQCICKYLPADILSGYATCRIGDIYGHCMRCDTS